MRICLFSNVFFPIVGGIQQCSDTLARQWAASGHNIVVVTTTPAEDGYDKQFPYRVIRLPRPGGWDEATRNADLVVSNGYAIRFLPRWVLTRQHVFFIHALFLGMEPRRSASLAFNLKSQARLTFRRAILPLAGHIFISHFIQENVGGQGVVIYNPIGDEFRRKPEIAAGNSMAFFGRMVEEKGVKTLLRALAHCRERGRELVMDMYGEGDQLDELRQLARELGVDGQLSWHGFVRGEALVDAMNRAKAIVVPSDWFEPMGIVAAEAMACGKCVIGSSGGGLGEVLEGYCPTFPNKDFQALAQCLLDVDANDAGRLAYEQNALRRAKDFKLDKIAAEYIDYFQRALGKSPAAERAGSAS